MQYFAFVAGNKPNILSVSENSEYNPQITPITQVSSDRVNRSWGEIRVAPELTRCFWTPSTSVAWSFNFDLKKSTEIEAEIQSPVG